MSGREAPTNTSSRADELYRQLLHETRVLTDHLFAGLLVVQWLGAIALAIWLSPSAWQGTASHTHVHVWAAVGIGGLLTFGPLTLIAFRPGSTATRMVVAVAQMGWSALLIHLMGGRIETHFHVFGSLAFLAAYRDWRVLIVASVTVSIDHFLRGFWWPQSLFGVANDPYWIIRSLEHVGWILFADLFLLVAIWYGHRDARAIAADRAELEATNLTLERQIDRRTRELQQHEIRTRAILDSALDCIVSVDHYGRIIEFNPAAERIFQWKREDVLGKNVVETLVSPHDIRDQARIYEYLSSGGGSEHNWPRLQAVRATGEVFVAEVTMSSTTVDAELISTACFRDLSERIRTETALRISQLETQKMAMVASATDNAVIICNHKAEIEWINDGFTRITGYKLPDAAGKNPVTLRRGPDTEATTCDDLLLHMDQGRAFNGELTVYTKHGNKVTVALEMRPIFDDDKLTHFIFVESDVSERKRAERMKDEFVSTVSHELRTPLTSIGGALGLVAHQLYGDLPDKVKHLIDIAKRNSDRLSLLINDILDMEKIESGKLELTVAPAKLMEIVESSIEENQGYATKHGTEYQLEQSDVDFMVTVDQDRLKQVMANLLSNAAKYAEGEPVTVSVEKLEQSVRVNITDRGPGIPLEFRSKLFEKFCQADPDSRQKGGTGLGLSITKSILEKFGGKIDFESEIGVGTTMYFLLPYQEILEPAYSQVAEL